MIYQINYHQILQRLFSDDTSLLVVRDTKLSANAFNNSLLKTDNWGYQWKISFNPDPSRQAQEAVFLEKLRN